MSKLHGMPSSIINDRDPIFLSIVWEELFMAQGVQLLKSTAYRPQTDGQTEVVNRTLYLRCMTGDKLKHWTSWLPLAKFWCNTNHHSAINMNPFEALYGYLLTPLIPYLAGDSLIEAIDKNLQSRKQIL